jgi:hypothetical protein
MLVSIAPDQQAYRLQLRFPLLLMLVRQQLFHTAQQNHHHHPLLLVCCCAALLRLMKPGSTAESSKIQRCT